ncbi:TonB-dependent receptor [Roseateles sp. GG27B]
MRSPWRPSPCSVHPHAGPDPDGSCHGERHALQPRRTDLALRRQRHQCRDIARSGVITINQAISKLLGVQTRQDLSGGADDALDLRGFGVTSGSNQIVIVDGLRLDEGDTSGARLAGIAIDTVERIEVLRGSGTVLSGEGGTAA